MRFCAIREEDGSICVGECSLCGDTVYAGEEYYRINGETVCCACLEEYARRFFAPCLCRGGEAE